MGSAPNIYHLCELKDTYDRYVVMLANEQSARILCVNLGAVTQQLLGERPELRKRVGREWTKRHYQNHRRERTKRFLQEKIEILEKVMSAGGHAHLILAGNPRILSRVEKLLPKHLHDRMVDSVPASANDRTEDIVAATLSAFIDQEESESQGVVDVLLREINTQGLGVAGAAESLRALWSAGARLSLCFSTQWNHLSSASCWPPPAFCSVG